MPLVIQLQFQKSSPAPAAKPSAASKFAAPAAAAASDGWGEEGDGWTDDGKMRDWIATERFTINIESQTSSSI